MLEIEAKHEAAAIYPEFVNRGGFRVAKAHLGLHGGFDLGVDFVLLNGLHFVSPGVLLMVSL